MLIVDVPSVAIPNRILSRKLSARPAMISLLGGSGEYSAIEVDIAICLCNSGSYRYVVDFNGSCFGGWVI